MTAPILFHYFSTPLPYLRTLALQQSIHDFQLQSRRKGHQFPDILLLLQHRPVYTGGRRQGHASADERVRLRDTGSEWVPTLRGGETTFHGPGQLVAYPLVDLGRLYLSVRDYVCALQNILASLIVDVHKLPIHKSPHTGIFLSEERKIASIGVQVQHRLTTHGFAVNVTDEPILWFDQVVACGLPEVRAVSISTAVGHDVTVHSQVAPVLSIFASQLKRDMEPLDHKQGEIMSMVRSLEVEAEGEGPWLQKPIMY
ncbi:uncharacterized protein EI90DRAFT_1446404 [Cantharellus anzutake]|uniref:uncharacterized protein n=1 Tax=Cantharellus anzutake TaxID=1750568 RepID=UPI0019040EC8|nr:uncharacterized protein EI90DRAFT_1446404 [Cantharellus anzutake]KAF8329087.1 hypothetical protein EI90DRAFT_1446404 [Cantharellus anzutake]